MYKLKQVPEDFTVKEISNVPLWKEGRYHYYLLKKKQRTTIDAIEDLAKILHIKEKQIGFAGNKDKQAITEQVISILGVRREAMARLRISNVHLTFLGCGNDPISLGDLEGNAFEIVIRNLDSRDVVEPLDFIPNYFDEQRFGKHNVPIGKHLLKKEFKEAVGLIQDPRCQEYLQEHPTDFVGALKRLPLRLLRLYVNAYQSYLWNETLATYLKRQGLVVKEVRYSLGTFVFVKEGVASLQIPLVGFSELPVAKDVENVVQEILQREQVDNADFIIRQIPELSGEGELRKAFVPVRDLHIGTLEKDELNKGKKRCLVRFSLGKGSYATLVVRSLLRLVE